MSIDDLSTLYACMKNSKIVNHSIYRSELQKVCALIKNLNRDLANLKTDEYWKEVLDQLMRYQFLLTAMPIPINSGSKAMQAYLETRLLYGKHSFPAYMPKLQCIADGIKALQEVESNPLLEGLNDHLKQGTNALLLKDLAWFTKRETIQTQVDWTKNIDLISVKDLRKPINYDNLFIIGPHYWFPKYIYQAPRANSIQWLNYSWIPNKIESHPIFLYPYLPWQEKHQEQFFLAQEVSQDPIEALINEEEQVPEINWKELSLRVHKSLSHEDENPQATIQAKLVLLAEEQGVFIADEGTKVTILDWTEKQDQLGNNFAYTNRITFTDLELGMYLLLRTEGGGEYIIPIANQILRNKAKKYRALQEEWKNLLRLKISENGYEEVGMKLIDHGVSETVSVPNIRNWAASDNIRPQEDDNFRAILHFVGLIERENSFFEAAQAIHKAHQQAGFRIKKLLSQNIPKADREEIETNGYITFALPDVEGGSITALRVEGISPIPFQVPQSKLGKLHSLK